MRDIIKFKIPITKNPTSLDVDSSSNCLTFQLQDDVPTLWIERWTKDIKKKLTVRIFGTGWEVPNNVIYIGSVLMNDDTYVWHLYREPNE